MVRVHVRRADLGEPVGHRCASRQEEPTLGELAQPRAQVEPEQSGESHGEVGVAVRVDGELGGLDALVTHDALDGGARLALVEHDGLGVKDAPAVADMAVHADGGGLATRVQARLPDAAAGLEAHHVGRRDRLDPRSRQSGDSACAPAPLGRPGAAAARRPPSGRVHHTR